MIGILGATVTLQLCARNRNNILLYFLGDVADTITTTKNEGDEGMPRRNHKKNKAQAPKYILDHVETMISIDLEQRNKVLYGDRVWTGVGR